jgi:iron complex outermembrane receptor protein
MRLLLALLLLPLSLSAQKVDTLTKQEITVSALRGTSTTPISQTSLDKAALNAKWFGQEISLQLTATPNVTAASDNGAYNGYTYMRLRGMDQTRINMTLNGVPLNEPEDQGVYFSNFVDFTSSIQSLQVQRGVGTSSNGTASYAGSINFESLNPFLRSQHVGAEWSWMQNSAVDISSAISGSTAAYGRFTKQNVAGYRDHADNRSSSGYLTTLTLHEKSTFRLTAFSGLTENGMAYLPSSLSAIEKNPMDNPVDSTERDHFIESFVSGAYTRTLSDQNTVSVTGYYIGLQGHYGVKIDSLWDFNLTSNWVGALGNWNHTTSRARVDVGVHANTYTRNHFLFIPQQTNEVYRNFGTKTEQSAFGKVDYSLTSALNVVGDVQVRSTDFNYHPDAHADIAASGIRWTFLNPKLGATLKTSQATKVYASFGQNSREPTRNDMFAGFDNVDTSNVAFVGSFSRVKPERVRDLEVGAEYHSSVFVVDGNLYLMNFHNEITPIGKLSYIGLPLRKNVNASYRRGIEVDSKYIPTSHVSVSSNLTLSRNRIREYTDDVTGTTFRNVRPLLTPEVISNHSITLTANSHFDISFDGRYVAASQLANTNDARFMTPTYFMTGTHTDITIGQVALLLWVNNLNNVRAFTGGSTDGVQPFYFVSPSRNLSIWVRWGF